jgi:hypothetical protein
MTVSSSGARESAPAGIYALVALQRADGRWDLSQELAKAIGVDLGQMDSAIAGASGNRDEVRSAWATALALAWLRQHASHVEEEWRLLSRKAQKWLDAVSARPAGDVAWIDAASRFLNASPGRLAAGPLDT